MVKLTLNDVIRVKEDLQFVVVPFGWSAVNSTYKVTTIINENSVLVQRCTENGALTHSETKRVRNPDMNWMELTDYYDILKTDDQDKLDCERGDCTPVGIPIASDEQIKDLLERVSGEKGFEVRSGGVVYGPSWKSSPFPTTTSVEVDAEIPSFGEDEEAEYTGGSSSYYSVFVESPTTEGRPQYMAEANDIIEALGMNYAEGNAFKALWRRAAARNLGKRKKGYDNGLYDSEKVEFFGKRLVVQSKKKE